MRNRRLDDMPMADVLRAARMKGDGLYWISVAWAKLNEYRKTMPMLERFTNVDWRANADRWQKEIEAISL